MGCIDVGYDNNMTILKNIVQKNYIEHFDIKSACLSLTASLLFAYS